MNSHFPIPYISSDVNGPAMRTWRSTPEVAADRNLLRKNAVNRLEKWGVDAAAVDILPNMAEITAILARIGAGDAEARSELLELLYQELRAVAGGFYRYQPTDGTLQPTALVHEVYVKLMRSEACDWRSKGHFMAVAATAMRQVLQDRARQRRTEKRGHGLQRWTLSAVGAKDDGSKVDVVAIDDALQKLNELNPRQARIVELRFFGGLGVDEVAEELQLSTSMVEKEWIKVRAWLSHELSGA